ncbi:MAG: hypothetical protein ACRCY4_07700 [Brevinema sp.]
MKLLLILFLLTCCTKKVEQKEAPPSTVRVESEAVVSDQKETLIPLEEWEEGMRWFPSKSLEQDIDLSTVSKLAIFDELTFEKFTNALKNQDFNQLTFLFDRKIIVPFLRMGGILEILSNGTTNKILFKNQGEVLAYTNQYGQIIFNDEKILLDERDLSYFNDKVFYKQNYMLALRNNSSKSDYHYMVEIIERNNDVSKIAQALNEYDYSKDTKQLSDLSFVVNSFPYMDFGWMDNYFRRSSYLPIYDVSLLHYGNLAFRMGATDANRNILLVAMLKQANNPSAVLVNGWLYTFLVGHSTIIIDENLQIFILP